MTHDPTHAIYLGAGALYFGGAFYFALKNYQTTKHDGYWFFMTLFSLSLTGAMIAGVLWSTELVSDEGVHPYYDTLFLLSAFFLFAGTYALSKKHHKVKVF